MSIEADSISTKEIAPTPIVQQTAYWARVKQKHCADSRAFHIKADLSGLYVDHPVRDRLKKEDDDLLVILQQIDDCHQLAYVPYGPKLYPSEEYQGIFLEELSEVLLTQLPKSCILIRYDLNWESFWSPGNDHKHKYDTWYERPEKRIQEMRFNFNTEKWNLRKASTDVLPSNTIFLDLKKSEDDLIKAMKSKTRYNIRLSKRRGIEVDSCGMENIGLWYELYDQTSKRNGIRSNDRTYFKNVLETKASDTKSPADVDLLIAHKGSEPLAAMFYVSTPGRATYLYGASSDKNRRDMAPYALQWEAVKKAKKQGCGEYDMFGISAVPDPAHPLYGLYRFKTGFGGDIYSRMGCWDYPIQQEKYEQFSVREMNAIGFHV